MAKRVGLVGGLVMLVAATASAQPPGGGGGRGGFGFIQSPVTLLAMEEVRTELGTDPDQNAKLQALAGEAREKMQSAFGDFQGFRDLSDDERAKRMADVRKKAEELNKEFEPKIAAVLKPEQRTRLDQLYLQAQGPRALAQAAVAEKLGLTQEQKDKVAEIVESRGSSSDFREIRERREKQNTDLLAVLNDGQKKTWEEMQGKKFTFPERRGGGEGRRRQE